MNLQQIRRVALCAALIALCGAGAGLLPTQPVAGQETKDTALRGAAALDQLKRDGQYDSLQAAMNQARFSVSRAEHTPLGRAAWRAPNPAAGYDAYITETGVSIAVNDGSYVSLSLQSLGYGAALRAVGPGEVYADKQTINLRRDGGVLEWYVNGPDGLEQGFTMAEPPGMRQAGVPLRLALEVSEGWRAVARDDGQQVTLRSGDGQAVGYGKLVVRDSLGRHIPARLAVADEQVVIEAEDHEATYPLTIDPLFSLQQKLVSADGWLSDSFGSSVALSGDTLVVGAYYDNNGAASQGAVYVFTRHGGFWTQQQKLTANDGEAQDIFGYSVALSGATLVVGAPWDNAGANGNQGSVYVFTRIGGVWIQTQKLTDIFGAAGDSFGHGVAFDYNTLMVSAFLDDADTSSVRDQGSVIVYTRSGGVWTQIQKLTASDGERDDLFGYDIALSGNTLVVGVPYDDIGANGNQGSVYVYTRNGATWTQQQKIFHANGAMGDWFGHTIAVSGETLAAGKWGFPSQTSDSVYVYTRIGATWTQQQDVFASDGATFDDFGCSIALSGNNLVVGARGDTIGANMYQGSAYVFLRVGDVWTERQKLTDSDGAAYDGFGNSVAISGDTVAVGAYLDDIGANTNQGSVSVFLRPPCSPLILAPASLPNGAIGIPYQQSLTVSGGQGPFHFALVSGALPPGLLLSSDGLLSGKPTMLGTYQFVIHATDMNTGCFARGGYSITITSCPTIMLDPPVLPNGAMGTPYSETLTATGGAAPYTFDTRDELPPGLSLSSNGVLSGTPKLDGNYNFRVVIKDANGCVSKSDISIMIEKSESEISAAPRAKRGSR